jgi:CRISPR system Cascade subunit CasA
MSLHYSLLDERLLNYRTGDGCAETATLPELLVALGADAVRDFPALRPHQRHPWHAFLVQLAAIAMHAAGRTEPFESAEAWRAALLHITPDHPDGAPWCLVTPPERPAFMQAPVPEGSLGGWKGPAFAADEIDMLVTSKNHDLKAARMTRNVPQDWVYALISLQTQEGFLGSGNYGISRMNGGFASRPAVGAVPPGGWARRWARDLRVLLARRDDVARLHALNAAGGIALTWLVPWDGASSLSFSKLDPLYIEVCRRVRLSLNVAGTRIIAYATGSKVARIAAKERCGVTGDAWTPIDAAGAKALTITGKGFDYKLACDLLFSPDYDQPAAQKLVDEDGNDGVVILAQSVTRGQGKTEGYHERRIPVSRRMVTAFRLRQTDPLARIAQERVAAIGEMRKVLWFALCVLFNNGRDKDASDSIKDKAGDFARPFEKAEDACFFDDLILEIESDAREAEREQWLLDLAQRADGVLREAFLAGPRSGVQRYRAQSAALGRFRRTLRSDRSPLPVLARLYRASGNSSVNQ